jgi:hypothetical protein
MRLIPSIESILDFEMNGLLQNKTPLTVTIGVYPTFIDDGGAIPGPSPDPGYAFVYHIDGRQIYHFDGRPVQVLEQFANS